jgi:hypothetical protein
MKKFFVSILALLYLSTSIGATIHFHYCMGKLISWGLIEREIRNCEYCGMLKSITHPDHLASKNNCCKDEQKQIKTDRDQKVTIGEWSFLKIFPDAVFIHFPNSLVIEGSSNTLTNPTTHAPPNIGKPPVFLLNCNFRI